MSGSPLYLRLPALVAERRCLARRLRRWNGVGTKSTAVDRITPTSTGARWPMLRTHRFSNTRRATPECVGSVAARTTTGGVDTNALEAAFERRRACSPGSVGGRAHRCWGAFQTLRKASDTALRRLVEFYALRDTAKVGQLTRLARTICRWETSLRRRRTTGLTNAGVEGTNSTTRTSCDSGWGSGTSSTTNSGCYRAAAPHGRVAPHHECEAANHAWPRRA